MGLISRIKTMFIKEKYIDTDLNEIPVFKTETPEKIIETRIRPVKIPTILDLGEKLSSISNNLSFFKEQMVTKSWFLDQYEDTSHEILKHLNIVSRTLNDVQNLLMDTNNLTKNLSDLLPQQHQRILNERLSPSEMIVNALKDNKKLRYKEIVSLVPFSDPTISKHIKLLLTENKIIKSIAGKAVYYELI